MAAFLSLLFNFLLLSPTSFGAKFLLQRGGVPGDRWTCSNAVGCSATCPAYSGQCSRDRPIWRSDRQQCVMALRGENLKKYNSNNSNQNVCLYMYNVQFTGMYVCVCKRSKCQALDDKKELEKSCMRISFC